MPKKHFAARFPVYGLKLNFTTGFPCRHSLSLARIFQENFVERKLAVFPGGISNSSRPSQYFMKQYSVFSQLDVRKSILSNSVTNSMEWLSDWSEVISFSYRLAN